MRLIYHTNDDKEYVLNDVKSIEDMDLYYNDCRLSTAKLQINFYDEVSWQRAKKFMTQEILPCERHDEDSFRCWPEKGRYYWIVSRCSLMSGQISIE